ncbi:MAG: DUF2155 domain-containing protein [Pseudomonadota bacterium]
MRAFARFTFSAVATVAGLAAGFAQAQQPVERGSGAVLRWMDRTNSETNDLEIGNASSGQIGSLRVELGECRYPQGNPSGDAFAFVTIHTEDDTLPFFSGWMIASSPALNALEHPRYDVWVLRCTVG